MHAWAKTETIKYKGEDIPVTGDVDYEGNVGDDGDLAIRWLSGTYKFEVRVLVVGGGGAGGRVRSGGIDFGGADLGDGNRSLSH